MMTDRQCADDRFESLTLKRKILYSLDVATY